METAIQIFNSPQFGMVRAKMIGDEPYFAGIDVATILGYTETDQAIRTHVDEEDKMLVQLVEFQDPLKTTASYMKGSKMVVINESGVYSLVFGSKLETAKEFKKWVTSEVLPAIRKHGGYLTSQKIEEVLSDPDTIIRLATSLKREKEERARLELKTREQEETIEKQAPKVLFADTVTASEKAILIADLAKILKQKGIEIGQNRLFEWLRDHGYLCSKGQYYNRPTQKSMELGLFEVIERTVSTPTKELTTFTTMITGKGQVYFVNKFLRKESLKEALV